MSSTVLIKYKDKSQTITVGIRYPFYDSWKQVTSVSETPFLQRTETERIINNVNMVYIKPCLQLLIRQVQVRRETEDAE